MTNKYSTHNIIIPIFMCLSTLNFTAYAQSLQEIVLQTDANSDKCLHRSGALSADGQLLALPDNSVANRAVDIYDFNKRQVIERISIDFSPQRIRWDGNSNNLIVTGQQNVLVRDMSKKTSKSYVIDAASSGRGAEVLDQNTTFSLPGYMRLPTVLMPEITSMDVTAGVILDGDRVSLINHNLVGKENTKIIAFDVSGQIAGYRIDDVSGSVLHYGNHAIRNEGGHKLLGTIIDSRGGVVPSTAEYDGKKFRIFYLDKLKGEMSLLSEFDSYPLAFNSAHTNDGALLSIGVVLGPNGVQVQSSNQYLASKLQDALFQNEAKSIYNVHSIQITPDARYALFHVVAQDGSEYVKRVSLYDLNVEDFALNCNPFPAEVESISAYELATGAKMSQISPKWDGVSSKKVVLWVPGGPNAAVFPMQRTGFIRRALESGIRVYTLAYRGTLSAGSDGIDQFRADIAGTVIEDVTAAIERIRATDPDTKIMLVGESLGGGVVAEAWSSGVLVDSVTPILINPGLDLIARYPAMLEQLRALQEGNIAIQDYLNWKEHIKKMAGIGPFDAVGPFGGKLGNCSQEINVFLGALDEFTIGSRIFIERRWRDCSKVRTFVVAGMTHNASQHSAAIFDFLSFSRK